MNRIVEPRSHENTKVLEPELRFSEFVGTYRKHLFDDLFEFSTGKNIKQNEASPEFEIPCVRYGELYHMYGEVISKIVNFTNLNSSELKFSKGDEILLPSAGEDPFDIGSASALALKNIAIGRTINILSPQKEGVYSPFYMSYYINQKQRKKISRLAKGVSISNVYNSDLKKLSAVIPDIQEQQKIAEFLSSVDKKIEQLTEKHRLLTEYKKGVMQQIFTQQIRFKDNQGNDYPGWEEKKLGQFGSIVGGGTPGTSQASYWEGDIQWFTPTEIKQKYMSKSIRTISEEGLKKSSAKLLPVGALLLTTRATIADLSIATKECSTNQGFQSIIVNDQNDNEFLYYWILNNRKLFIRKASGSTFPEISKKEIEKIEGVLPQKEEQQKIANFLTEIDQKIDQAWSTLEQTKAFKKGLLQKMFV